MQGGRGVSTKFLIPLAFDAVRGRAGKKTAEASAQRTRLRTNGLQRGSRCHPAGVNRPPNLRPKPSVEAPTRSTRPGRRCAAGWVSLRGRTGLVR